MKIVKPLLIACLTGLCALMLGATTAHAAIMGHHHHHHRHHQGRRHIRHLQTAYANAKASGHMHQAAAIHHRAMAIRHDMHQH
jgi:hypothetical protein